MDTALIVIIVTILIFLLLKWIVDRSNKKAYGQRTHVESFRDGEQSARYFLDQPGYDPKELRDQIQECDPWSKGWIAECNKEIRDRKFRESNPN